MARMVFSTVFRELRWRDRREGERGAKQHTDTQDADADDAGAPRASDV